MADQLAALAFHASKPLAANYDTIYAKSKRTVKKARGRERDDYDDYYRRGRAKSSGGYRSNADRGRGYSDRRSDRDDDSYDSEASIPPINRRRQGRSSVQESNAVRTRGGGRRSSSSGSNSSSSSRSSSDELPLSTDDEKKEKQIRRGELITGGLAAVASVHAAGTVWSSMEARDAREEAVANGTLSKEEAKKERRKNQFQDVAALGLAALAIKGAYGKWKGTVGQHQAKLEHRRERNERHQKRVEKGLDRESRRSGGRSIQGGGGNDRKAIEGAKPGYDRGYTHSENDLSRSNGGARDYQRGSGRDYDDRDHDRSYDRAYDRYSRDV